MDCKYGKDRRIRIADRLREERKSKRVTQDKMAEDLLISKPTIISWEKKNGKNKVPSPDQILALCEYFDCDYGYIICEYDSRKHENADIQDQIGLSEQAIELLKWFNKPHNKVQFGTFVDFLDKTITNHKPLSGLMNDVHLYSFEFRFGFLEDIYDIDIDEIKKSFTRIYNSDKLNEWQKYDSFRDSIEWRFSLSDTYYCEDGEYDKNGIIYKIFLHLVDETERRTENQYLYSINKELERIVIDTLDIIPPMDY